MRTYNEIYQAIIDKKDLTPELADLTSISQSAIWKLLAHLTATAIYIFEGILYTETAMLETKIERNKYGFIRWYAIVAQLFQYNDNLLFDENTGNYGYAVIDESLQIITHVSARENKFTSEVVLKVSKTEAGLLTKLTTTELTAFTAYMQAVKVAGTNLRIISENADIVMINGTVKYSGQYSLLSRKELIGAALLDYRNSFDYNGIIRANDIIQIIRDVPGVVDFVLSVLTGEPDGGSAVAIVDEYETYSGHFNYSVTNPEDNFTFEAV